MKILIASYFAYPGGSGVSAYISHLYEALTSKGIQVDILTHSTDGTKYQMTGSQKKSIDKKGITPAIKSTLTRFYPSGIPQTEPDSFEWERYSLECGFALFDLDSYDLIHAQDIFSARAIARITKTPVIATLHGALLRELHLRGEIWKNTEQWRFITQSEWMGAQSVRQIIVPSRWLKSIYVHDFHVPDNKLTVIPYGINVQKYLQQAKGRDVPWLVKKLKKQNKKVICCIARLATEKGQDVLIKALNKLQATRGDWVCLFIGDGAEKTQLQQLSRQLHLDQKVFFLGHRNHIPAWLESADVIIQPSKQDNQPFIVMESQLHRKPIIVSNAGGLPEMVQHGVTGLVFQNGNSQTLSEQIHYLLSFPKKAKKMGTEGFKFRRLNGSSRDMGNRTLSIYKKIT